MLGGFDQVDQAYGSARVLADGTSNGPLGFRSGRITATSRLGAGAFQITLAPGLSTLESFVACAIDAFVDTVPSVLSREIHWQHFNATTILVVIFHDGVPVDLDFKVHVRKVRQINTP